MKESKTVTRRYVFTQSELKEKLGIVGNITKMDLWAGLSPKDEEEGQSRDKTRWFILTEETTEEEPPKESE